MRRMRKGNRFFGAILRVVMGIPAAAGIFLICLFVPISQIRAGEPAEGNAVGTARGPDLKAMVWQLSEEAGVNPRLVDALIIVESGYNPKAVSPKGAVGMMQLMPETSKRLRVEDPFDPEQNIRAGIQELSRLLDRYSGNVALALAAYNAGDGAVRKYGGIPPYGETRRYVRKIMYLYSGQRYYFGQKKRRSRVRLLTNGPDGKIVITNQKSSRSNGVGIAGLHGGSLGGGFGK